MLELVSLRFLSWTPVWFNHKSNDLVHFIKSILLSILIGQLWGVLIKDYPQFWYFPLHCGLIKFCSKVIWGYKDSCAIAGFSIPRLILNLQTLGSYYQWRVFSRVIEMYLYLLKMFLFYCKWIHFQCKEMIYWKELPISCYFP